MRELRSSFATSESFLKRSVKMKAVFDIRKAPECLLESVSRDLLKDCSTSAEQFNATWNLLGEELILLEEGLGVFYKFNSDLNRSCRYKKKDLKKLRKEVRLLFKLGGFDYKRV